MMRSVLCTLATVIVVFAVTPTSYADPAAAEGLFREGRKALEAGRVAEACDLFAESQRQDPSSGTLLNLADCRERLGRVASAWADFLSAARLAAGQGLADRTREAKRRAALLEPRVSYLTINVLSPIPGLVLRRGNEILTAAASGTRLPIDPGEHTLTASAPGHIEYRTTFSTKHDADNIVVDVPKLEPSAIQPEQPRSGTRAVQQKVSGAAATDLDSGRGAARPVPTSVYLAAGGSVLALGIGAYFGMKSLSSYHDADATCPSHSSCSPDSLTIRSRAETQAWISNAGLGLGLGLAAVSAILFIARPADTSTPTVGVGYRAGSTGVGLDFSGAF